ncbi:methyl-accepting chemotaxis protein [Undibacterium sp. SXout7W]|uniref:methyl-accepting chemotaxis protein n=1 Tax=Undibacterium sp. SXout7W TaxID=3413049 RepID=UPI003BF08F51
MKKILNVIMNFRIWNLGANIMRQLRFPSKLLLISTAFLLPLVWLLAAYLHSVSDNLDFANKERAGIRYAMTVYPALDMAGTWRYHARIAAFGEGNTQVAETRAAFEDAFKKVEAVDQEYSDLLGTKEAIGNARTLLKEAQTAQATPEDVGRTMVALSRSLVSLLEKVTDGSGLALDPELPSYYLMSAVLMRAPEIIQSTAELRGLGGGALKAGQVAFDVSRQIQERLAVIDHEKKLAADDLGKVHKAAPAYFSSMTTSAVDATTDFVGLVRKTFPVGQTEATGDRAAYIAAANQTLQLQFAQVSKNLQVLDSMLADRQNDLRKGLWITLAISVLGLVLASYLFIGFYRSMIGGFKQLRRQLINIAMGDLRADIRPKGKDEMAGMLKEVANMQRSLIDTVQQVQVASDHVVRSSIEIAQGTHDLSARTESAASALEQSSAALEQTTSTVQMTAESVRQASQISIDNAATATRGGQVMQDVVQTMENIQDSSKKISDIISVIDGIAFQTNILALNAAVEAARAGEQGRGFAVVATEVRALAARSADAAREIKSLITSSTEQIEAGTVVVRNAGHTMTEIVENADRIKHLLDDVANGAREQSMGVAQIGQAISELDRNTQANATLVEETAASANSQRGVAVRLAAQVDEFRLPGNKSSALVEGIDVDMIIDAHRQWKVKLRESIEKAERVDVKTLSRDDCCALGKWIYADGQRLRERQTFTALVEKHARFHKIAGQVGELINQGSYEQAEDALAHGTPFSGATSEVVLVLSEVKRLGFQ